jgi:UDPglucose--hexose-1-phosphate uridylyltransferase
MLADMEFPCEKRLARLHSPLKDFELDEQLIEHRRDPLTGRRSIVLKGRREYVKRYIQTDEQLLTDIAQQTREGCPFCPEKAAKSTPRFPADLTQEGGIRVGEARTFPSLFAHSEYNAVTVVTDNHYLRPKEFTMRILADALTASTCYLSAVQAKDPKVRYGAVLMNCLPPAGSTLVHPHMQALASDQAFNMLAEVDLRAREYWKTNGSNFWKDLLADERRRKERYLGSLGLGISNWIMAFSPIGFDEVWGIAYDTADLTKITNSTLSSFADGFSRVLKYYDELDIRSFNAILFSSPFGDNSPHGSIVLKIASRYGFQSHNVNDIWGLRYFLDESEVFDSPEDIAAELRRYFI